MSDILARKYRPRNLDELVGQESLVVSLRNQFASGRIPKAYLFYGESGAGKTSISKILALLLQGDPLRKLTADDWENFAVFDIDEKNAADVNGVDAMRELISSTVYKPRFPSLARVYILNEAHKLTAAAQEALLDPTEKAEDTVWILATTEPEAFKITFRRRFCEYKLVGLDHAALYQLLLKVSAEEQILVDADILAAQLISAGITSPGRALMALEKVASGSSIGEAVGAAVPESQAKELCRDLLKGEWGNLAKALDKMPATEVSDLRYRLLAYLKRVVVGNGNRSDQAAKMIVLLTEGAPYEPPAMASWFTARLYQAVHEHGRA